MRSSGRPVEVHPDATTMISTTASVAYPRETGGLLLGWWNNGQVIIRYAIEVPDPYATTNSWSRDENSAQTTLDSALAADEHQWLGYVGDWHSHPAPSGTSRQDLASIQRASTTYDQPLVLLVHRADGTIEVTIADRGTHRRTYSLTAAPRRPAAR